MSPGLNADENKVSRQALLSGLDAQFASDCRVLVLGSTPGAASLQAQRHYAHPRNRFWPVMSALLALDGSADYADRLAGLQACGVGLWDVIARCERSGSLDATIRRASIVANPLPEAIASLPALRAVACNGAEAHRAWQRHVADRLPAPARDLPVLALPSTSPANAACSAAQLRQAWSAILPYLEPAARR